MDLHAHVVSYLNETSGEKCWFKKAQIGCARKGGIHSMNLLRKIVKERKKGKQQVFVSGLMGPSAFILEPEASMNMR